MSEAETLRRAGRAAAELEQTGEAFAAMRANAVETLLASKDAERELREALYRAVQVIDAVQAHLRQVVDGGRVAELAEEMRALTGAV